MRALCLLAVLLLAKLAALWGLGHELCLWTPVAFLWQDLALCLVLGVLDEVARRPRIGWGLYALLALQAAVHVPLVRSLGAPLTAPMLQAVDTTLSGSVAHHLTGANLAWMALVISAAVALPLAWRRMWPARVQPARALGEGRRRAAVALTALVVASSVVGMGPHASRHAPGGVLLANPLVTLVRTAFPRLAASAADRDWRGPAAGSVASPPREGESLPDLAGAARGRSVVLVVLESAGAGYLAPYGAAEDPMPRLTALAAGGVTFENSYCVYPESIKGLVSLLFSTYPAIDTVARDYTRLRLPSLAHALAETGYDTGLFHSGRFDYLGMQAVVDATGFARAEDAGDIGGNHESSFGVDEPSTVSRMLSWVDALPADRPFLLAYLPIAGHHPYDSPPGGPFDEEEEIGCYRNALHHADRCLGELIDGLQARRGDDLLWVVVGDHGQAFGQHARNYGHTLQLYEENVRIPLVIAAPGLTDEGYRVSQVTSSLDVAPTVCELLGLIPPAAFQGRNALASAPSSALFFTDYAEALLGLREDHWKTILEIESGRTRLFDLRQDPDERTDLAPRHPELADRHRQHLLAWAAAQRAHILH